MHPERPSIPTAGASTTSRLTERAAWAFYLIAAAGSSVGQIWVAVTTPPWPDTIAWWWRALLVLPFAVVIDLGGVVTAAFADTRRRLGENATGWRLLSAGSAVLAVAINVIGHHHTPYLAAVFGGLGVFAYTVWPLHSAARRRDALRAIGKLTDTAPVYGLIQWWREPAVTRRACALAVQHGYSVQQSLTLARAQLRDERRTAALSIHVETLIRARHDDPTLAAIAATTIDIDAVAAALSAQADIDGWARAIGVDLVPPTPEPAAGATAPDLLALDAGPDMVELPKDVLRRVPVQQADYDHWRGIWQTWQQQPDDSHHTIAGRHDISARQAQWIRAAGTAGLLHSPIPPITRLQRLIQANGHTPGGLPSAP
ncbi:hypothetical protein [Paractinoplanes rishiriensis]|uniref:Uncharacterized protein n=1 Tax=Paractinoplanes rishiriensis TaxID=1050105 RepID=A0A919KAY4_9ACTN|nr:hypothetical protein [Actinoplanes rishiriensis]GIF02013.1 hypothetical protein Ari01nite_94770 [Actinoplanes rishiriensis]